VSAPAIVLYVSGWCPFCQRAQGLLTKKGLAYRVVDIDEDANSREEMMARSGRRSVPQVFIGDTHVGGCDDLFALEGSGELDRMIQGV
jgi:glutaredoxin 3